MDIDFPLKQRLVGIAVVVSLAVIFLPLLLDGAGMVEKPQYKQLSLEVPPAPVIDRKKVDFEKHKKQTEQAIASISNKKVKPTINQQEKKKNRKDSSQTVKKTENKTTHKSQKVTQKAEKKPVEKHVKKPVVAKTNTSSADEGWIVQVGSFKSQEKAFNLQKTVRAYKIADVFIQKTVLNKSISYRVRMGPFLYKKQASAAVKKLNDKYKMKSFVRKHSK